MKNIIAAALAVFTLSSVPAAAYADSTTGTSFTVDGMPASGETVAVRVVVTGKHLVDGPGRTVYGGDLHVTVQGNIFASARAAYANSHVTDSGCVQFDGYGNCIRTKYIADRTEVTFAVTLPMGVSSFQIGARYTGDTDSHSSEAPTVNLQAVYPKALAAPISLLLD